METIRPIGERTPEITARILLVWEMSVRATHGFLTEGDIVRLRPQVEEALDAVSLYSAVDRSGEIQGFLGVHGDKIEMLFIHPDCRGAGIGKALLRFATETLGARCLDVNEQNPGAVGFYEHMGFSTVSRSATDGQGNPFPLLHMRKDGEPV